ncbi:hypothetical protein UCRPC4_g05800 [Phaeomoniella chlamydospora]|uniref:Uncharacterized protein n=1 Tax=Phaeomoniella chlamydospora TaxID=158046 RepID=A0A0G2E1D5_PHACM|nr:hypothetical protein UCRPC4_g05800 [Phaeomoniella chlamydospora]
MSGHATGTGADTHSSVNANRLPNGAGQEAKASNVSKSGDPDFYGHHDHNEGPHSKKWQNVLDPRVDSNNPSRHVRAEAEAQARAETERTKEAEVETVRARERGDAEAQRRAEGERAEAEKRAEAARARANGKAEAEADAQRAVHRAQEDKHRAVQEARINAERDAEERKRKEQEQAERERLSQKGGVRDAVVNIAKNAHGAGESIRGRFNGKVDERFGDQAAANEHREIAREGEHKIGQNSGR